MRMAPIDDVWGGGGGPGGYPPDFIPANGSRVRVLPVRGPVTPIDSPPVLLPAPNGNGYQVQVMPISPVVTPAQGTGTTAQPTTQVVTPAQGTGTTNPPAATATSSTSSITAFLSQPLPSSIVSSLPASVQGIVGSVPMWGWLGLGALIFFGRNKEGRGRY